MHSTEQVFTDCLLHAGRCVGVWVSSGYADPAQRGRQTYHKENTSGPSEAEALLFIDSVPGTSLCLGISSLRQWSVRPVALPVFSSLR